MRGALFGERGGDPLYGLGGDDGGGSAGEKWRWTVSKRSLNRGVS
jgi:hypothetical protein